MMEDRIHIVSYPGPDRSISEKSIESKNMIARKLGSMADNKIIIPDGSNKNRRYKINN